LENICVEIYEFNIVILNEFSILVEAVKRFSVKETDTEKVIKVAEMCNRPSKVDAKGD